MESGGSNKTIWIILGAAAGLIGGALIYSALVSKESEDEDKEF